MDKRSDEQRMADANSHQVDNKWTGEKVNVTTIHLKGSKSFNFKVKDEEEINMINKELEDYKQKQIKDIIRWNPTPVKMHYEHFIDNNNAWRLDKLLPALEDFMVRANLHTVLAKYNEGTL